MKRSAYTLIELCVVISIVVVVAGITAVVLPSLLRGDRVTASASQLQGWLLESRQRAEREQVMVGLRLWGMGGTNPTPLFVDRVQPIQAPEPWNPQGTLDCQPIFDSTSGYPVLVEVRCTAYGGLDLTAGLPQIAWPVQQGDSVRFFGGSPRAIVNVTSTYFDVYSPNIGKTFPVGTTSDPANQTIVVPAAQFDIVRSARVIEGEGIRQLAKGTVIDLALAQMYGALLTPGPYTGSWDILFSPSGTLLSGLGGSQGRLLLWIREEDADQNGGTYMGSHLIVSVRPNGTIAVDALDQSLSGNNYTSPFSFTQNPRAGGF